MGMYTLFHLGVILKADTSEHTIKMLHVMCGEAELKADESLPDHPLFKTPRWFYMLTSDSYYFPHETTHVLKRDPIDLQWRLTFVTNFKNYSNEISLFLNWLVPEVDALEGEFLGYFAYEEDEIPTLVFMPQPARANSELV